MFGKLRTKHLLLIVAALIAAWWLSGHFSASAQKRTFREVIMQVDTARIDSFTIVPATYKQVPALHFSRSGKEWKMAMGTDVTVADDAAIRELLASLSDMRTVRLVGHIAEVQNNYDLSDSICEHLIIHAADGQHILAVGRTTTSDPPMTVVSVTGDENAYAINGRLGALTDKSFGDWMPKYLVRGDPLNWRKLEFHFPGDTGYVIERHGTGWTIGGVPADSSRTAHYLGSLARAHGQSVTDPMDTLQAVPAFELVVDDTTRAQPIVVMIFAVHGHFIIRSSLNPGSVMPFDGKTEVPRLFRPRSAFL